ncbi:hypothetical protein [uncultured Leptotrichia sp.]|jgi:hypothetical protein|uniref:hypothetical protein n=1 Tax=uncultured Leptotrichia sp. TaxID=159271 RepID=UPI00260A0A0B|nr:hypothetical protein [uncultured Leptotrichia sp.]
MLKKIKDWVGSNLDVYKVENANDVGAGLVRHIWKGEETASQIGTTLTAQIMNDLQKGLVHTLNATRTAGTNKDIYEVALSGIEEFGVFDGLKLLVRIDGENQFEDVFLKLGGTEYQIHQLKNNLLDKVDKGILKDKKEYLLNFKNNSFVLSDSTLYGLQKGTSLEGNRLAEIIGLEFGGNIQDTGNKTKGKFYFDSVTKFYYECIADTNLTYNDATKFRAISNKPISDRVEGLLEIGSNHIKFSNGIILGFGTCIASPSGTMNNYGINMGGITSLILTVNGGTYIASGETTSGTTFKARTNAPGNVSASYLAIGKWK